MTLSLFILLGVGSCRKKGPYRKRDLTYFREHLKSDMDYNDVVDEFGTPPQFLNEETADNDGLYIYQYPLLDSTFVRIGFTDKIVYACWVDKHSNLVEDVVVFNRHDE
jgi:hypothetical protein